MQYYIRVVKPGYVYILASQKRGTLYTGVTSNLVTRMYKHQSGLVDGFSKKYNVKMLVWYECYDDIREAIRREKQMKWWKRAWKIRLIEESNPFWEDLSSRI